MIMRSYDQTIIWWLPDDFLLTCDDYDPSPQQSLARVHKIHLVAKTVSKKYGALKVRPLWWFGKITSFNVVRCSFPFRFGTQPYTPPFCWDDCLGAVCVRSLLGTFCLRYLFETSFLSYWSWLVFGTMGCYFIALFATFNWDHGVWPFWEAIVWDLLSETSVWDLCLNPLFRIFVDTIVWNFLMGQCCVTFLVTMV